MVQILADKETVKMDDEGAKRLVCAVVMQAVKDYKRALMQYNKKKRRDEKQLIKDTIQECEKFFRNNPYCGINGDMIIEKLRDDVRNDLEKRNIVMEVPE